MTPPSSARSLLVSALGLLLWLLVLELLGGRDATVVLTGSMGPTAPLGLLYVIVWLLSVILVPPLLAAAAIEAALTWRRGRSIQKPA